jgi:thioredoxin 1
MRSDPFKEHRRTAMSSATELSQSNFDTEVQNGVTLLDFWAEWCGPCKAVAPVIDQLAKDYEGKARVAKINVDNEGALAERFNVSSIPTLLVMKNGAEVKRFIGVTSKSDLAAALDSATG